MMARLKTYLLCTLLALAAGGSAVAEELEGGTGGNMVLVSQVTSGYPVDEVGETNLYARAHYTWLANPNLAFFLEGELGRGLGMQLAPPAPHWGVNDTYHFGLGGVVSGFAELRQAYIRLIDMEPYDAFVGQVDLSEHFNRNEFAKDEWAQFMAPSFVTDPMIDFPADETLSAMLSYVLAPGMIVRLGCSEYTAIGFPPAYWTNIFNEDAFWITEFEMKLGDEGKLLVDVWSAPAMDSQAGLPPDREHPLGLSVSFDYEVNGLGIFARYGARSKGLYSYNQALSGGVVYKSAALGEKNALGGGFVLTSPSADFAGADDGTEGQVEIFFRWELPFGVQIIPDLQIISNPGGDASADTLTIFGVRMNVPF